MPDYKFGDIVLIKFPFTDNLTFKKRPALIIKDTNDGDVIVCRITSKFYNTKYDLELKNWSRCGLKLPSVIRVHKIASIEKEMVEARLGTVDGLVKSEIGNIIKRIFHSN
jgi:mRNA interferase MazF